MEVFTLGFIGSVLGTQSGNSGGAGLRYKADGADLYNPVTNEQVKDSYTNQQDAFKQQQSFLQALQGQNGIQNQSDVYNQYSNLASGNGPSVAQAQLNQATGANVANQAALMAGQRGAGANVGLMARQAAQQGAGIQQNAIGQAAQIRAQEQLAAMGQQAALATQQVGQQQNATQFSNQAAQSEQQNLLNAVAAHNNALVGSQDSVNKANSGIAGIAAQGQQKLMSNVLGAAGGAAGMANGGVVSKAYADGGEVKSGSFLYQHATNPQASKDFVKGFKQAIGTPMAHGGKVPALLSPGEGYLPPDKVKQVVKGKADPVRDSKKVPGTAKVKGDSLKNDTVKASLDAGGIVIPRSVMNAKNPKKEAYKFIEAELAKHNFPSKPKK